MLCNATCLLPNTTVFLACCYGGNLSVAQSVFSDCPSVSTIVGSEGKATKEALMLAFHAVLYNFAVKETTICEAAKRASAAAQLDISCRDIFTLQSSGVT